MQSETVIVHLPDGGSVEISLDRSLDVALHVQIFEQLKHFIGTTRLQQGAELPSVRRLASDLGVSAVTVGRAIQALRDRGIVETISGKGVYVVDFAQKMGGRSTEERVQDFSATVLRRALSLGLDPSQVVAELQELLASEGQHRDRYRIVVVDEFDSVEVTVEGLRDSLAADGFDVTGIRLAEMDEAAELIDRAGTIIAAPHCFGLVRQRLATRASDIIGITLTLDPAVLAQLRALPASSNVVLTATVPAFLGWMSYVVAAQALLDATPVGVAMTEPAAVTQALSGADVVVYGSGCRRELPAMIPDDVHAIELRHLVDTESLHVLRSRLKALTSDAADGS